MNMSSSAEITGLLLDWSEGDVKALDELLPLVEKELHRLAHYQLRRMNPGNTLQTTALINETYLRLINQNKVRWQNRAHFFGIAATLMRRIILNYLRDQKRLKRGGGGVQISLSEVSLVSPEKTGELLALDEALDKLARFDERKSRVIELRFFGGLSVEETAEVLKVSPITVMRDWNLAKAWLAREIRNEN
jgi:RNA polymerase sigma-70 factor, ECF subfamily